MKKLVVIFFLSLGLFANAQVGVGTETPAASAILDITSTNRGLLPPRIALTSATDVSTIVNPANGLLVYCTGAAGLTEGYYYYANSKWNNLVTFPLYGASNNSANTALGLSALSANTTGTQNVAIGRNALLLNTTGGNNTAIGHNALDANTSSFSNTAIGQNTLGANTTGGNNTAIGVNALANNSTGSLNTANGNFAGQFIANGTTANLTPNNSVFLGANTKANADNETNQIVIGENATGLGSNSVVLGNANITITALRGSVGIGQTAPAYNLDVNGTARVVNVPTITTATKALVKDPTSGQISEQQIGTFVFGDVKSGFQTTDHNGWVRLNGRAINTLTAAQQTAAQALGFTTNLPNADNSYLSQNGAAQGTVTNTNNTVTLTQANLPNVQLGGSTNTTGNHGHWIDPPNTNTSTNGQHSHTSSVTGSSWDAGGAQVGGFSAGGFSLNRMIVTVNAAGDHNHSVDIGGFWSSGDQGNHNHTVTTNSINGGVTQTAVNIAPRTLTVNMFVYLGL